MNLLRKTAQLVEDLRTLDIIKKNDNIEFEYCYNGEVALRIYCESQSQVDTIKNAIEYDLKCNHPELVRECYSKGTYKLKYTLKPD